MSAWTLLWLAPALACCGCGASVPGPSDDVPTVAIAPMPAATASASTPEPANATAPVAPRQLGLAVLLTPDGIALKTSAGHVAPGCMGLGRGLTLPKRGDGHFDYDALKRCARRLKDDNPRFRDERGVTLMAAADLPHQAIILVMDALREDERGALFPDITFAVAEH